MFNYLYYVDTIDDSKLAGLMKNVQTALWFKISKAQKNILFIEL